MSNPLSPEEFKTLIGLAKRVMWADPDTRREIQKHSINIVPANFYSEVPQVEDITNSFEYRDESSQTFNHELFDDASISEFIDEISAYANEFDPPVEGDSANPAEFFWKNGAFSYSDAMAYYCVVRHFKPSRIVEIGSGFSTYVANQALLKNGSGNLTLIEPYPKDFLRTLKTVDNIIESFVQDIPVDELVALIESGELWFIDSTHTVKNGSDCLYIYLKIMPELKKEMIIHTHDVFLPYGMPQGYALNQHIYWTEQYLLYAYMLDNPRVEVLMGCHHAARNLRDKALELMQGKFGPGGGSIWYRLKGQEELKKAA